MKIIWTIYTADEIGEVKQFEFNVEKAKEGHNQLRRVVKDTMKAWPEFKEELRIEVSCEDKMIEADYMMKAQAYKNKLLKGIIKL